MFYKSEKFNQDVSKWNTGAVTTMKWSKCTLSPFLWPGLSLLCFLNVQQLEFRRTTLLTRFVIFNFVFLKWSSFLMFVVGWSFLFFVAPSLASCSVSKRKGVQSGRVEMEYGGGDNYDVQ